MVLSALQQECRAAASTWEVPSETEGLDFKFHFISTISNFYIAGCGVVVPILGSVVVALPRSLRREASWTQAAEEESEKGLRDPEERGGGVEGEEKVCACAVVGQRWRAKQPRAFVLSDPCITGFSEGFLSGIDPSGSKSLWPQLPSPLPERPALIQSTPARKPHSFTHH